MARAANKGSINDDVYSVHAISAITPRRFVAKAVGGYQQNTAAGGRVDGVARYGAASGAEFGLYRGGIQLVEAGAAVADGDLIMSDNQGRAVTLTSTNFRAGVSQGVTTAAGQFVEVLLTEAV